MSLSAYLRIGYGAGKTGIYYTSSFLIEALDRLERTMTNPPSTIYADAYGSWYPNPGPDGMKDGRPLARYRREDNEMSTVSNRIAQHIADSIACLTDAELAVAKKQIAGISAINAWWLEYRLRDTLLVVLDDEMKLREGEGKQ